jgi:transposase-like protein
MTKQQVDVITSVQRRRRWSRAKKGGSSQRLAPGAVASEVAREAGIHSSQLFRWRQQLSNERLCLPHSPVTIAPEPEIAVLPPPRLGDGRYGRDRVCGRRPDADHRSGRCLDGVGADQGAGEGPAAPMIGRAAYRCGWRPATRKQRFLRSIRALPVWDPNRTMRALFCCAAQQSAAPSMAPVRDGGEKKSRCRPTQ